eukprot:TRINITY_DN1870_c0_g3_i3.p1 TRINITY_DN1870_c0_g3~~TRINITY_DN1870_c0_g3_i3.p1  ORF type:complete len:1112 (-),score=161.38 TRINITY_DN1870_c0_g3_i3:46-3381(-)
MPVTLVANGIYEGTYTNYVHAVPDPPVICGKYHGFTVNYGASAPWQSHMILIWALDSRNQLMLVDIRPIIETPQIKGQLSVTVTFDEYYSDPLDSRIHISSYWAQNNTHVGDLSIVTLSDTVVSFSGAYPVIGNLSHYLYYQDSRGKTRALEVLETPHYIGDRGFYTAVLPSGYLTLCDPDYEYYPLSFPLFPSLMTEKIRFPFVGQITREHNFTTIKDWQTVYEACSLQSQINSIALTSFLLDFSLLPPQRSGSTTFIWYDYQNVLMDGSTQLGTYMAPISLVNYVAYGSVDPISSARPLKITGFACDSDFPSLIVNVTWLMDDPKPGVKVPTSGTITARAILERLSAPCSGMPGFEVDLTELYPCYTYILTLTIMDLLATGTLVNSAPLANGNRINITITDTPPVVHQIKVYPPGSTEVDILKSGNTTIILEDASKFTASFIICDLDFPEKPLNLYVNISGVVTVITLEKCTPDFTSSLTWTLPIGSGSNYIVVTADNYASNGRERAPELVANFTIVSQINVCATAPYCAHGTCHNDPVKGSYQCSCDFGYTPAPDGLSCIEITICSFTDWSDISECSNCERGMANRWRTLAENNTALPQRCFREEMTKSVQCAFPCEYTIEHHGEPSASNLCTYLVYQYTNANQFWINQIIPDRNVNVVSGGSVSCLDINFDKNSKKRGASCSTDPYVTSVLDTLVAEMSKVLPVKVAANETSKLQFMAEDGEEVCIIRVMIEPDASGLTTGALSGIVVSIVVIVIIVLVVGYVMYKKIEKNKWLNSLPEYLRFHFDIQRAKSENWKKDGSLYYKPVKSGSKDHERLVEICKTLGLVNFPISESYAIMNELLASNFANTRAILEQRMTDSPTLFMTQDWRFLGSKTALNERHVVFEAYQKLTASFFWNQDEKNPIKVPVIPLVHGTGEDIAWSIAKKGFASLATLDAGFYGKGIYLTSFARYALPYCLGKDKPAFLISFSFPGNIFPVIEEHDGPQTLLGQALRSGYQSNYVLTNKEGFIEKDPLGAQSYYDEVVLSGESQVVPAYLICLDGSKKEELNKIVRETGSAMEARERLTEPEVDLFSKSSSFRRNTLSFFSLPKMGWSKVSEDEDDKYYEL